MAARKKSKKNRSKSRAKKSVLEKARDTLKRSRAAKKGWKKRLPKRARLAAKRSRAAQRGWMYRRLKDKLQVLLDLEEDGIDPKNRKPQYAAFYEEKLRAKQALGMTRYMAMLEVISEDKKLGEIGWNIVY